MTDPINGIAAPAETEQESGHAFGTFNGVFLPSILTMLGAIMFLRVNYVTGTGGIAGALLILVAGVSIVLATALSISAISTNTPVKSGGVYFLISRTLGPGFGGSIGITLFLPREFPYHSIFWVLQRRFARIILSLHLITFTFLSGQVLCCCW